MKEIMTSIFFGIAAIVALVGIKMVDLPAVITILLVLITVVVAVFGIAGGFSKKVSLEKRTEEKVSSIHETEFNIARKALKTD